VRLNKLSYLLNYLLTTSHTDLDTSLVAEQIDSLPVATIERCLMPVFRYRSTSTQAHDIQVRKHPVVPHHLHWSVNLVWASEKDNYRHR